MQLWRKVVPKGSDNCILFAYIASTTSEYGPQKPGKAVNNK
jgi:hypothetical protein